MLANGEALEKELSPLPFSKRTRVWFELARTFAAWTSATVNVVVLMKVFHVI